LNEVLSQEHVLRLYLTIDASLVEVREEVMEKVDSITLTTDEVRTIPQDYFL
jgi:hypothetical protein